MTWGSQKKWKNKMKNQGDVAAIIADSKCHTVNSSLFRHWAWDIERDQKFPVKTGSIY
jgi:hypothetical protein